MASEHEMKDKTLRIRSCRIIAYKSGKTNCNADALSRIPAIIPEAQISVLTRSASNKKETEPTIIDILDPKDSPIQSKFTLIDTRVVPENKPDISFNFVSQDELDFCCNSIDNLDNFQTDEKTYDFIHVWLPPPSKTDG